MAGPASQQRIIDLLDDPREELSVEIKSWLDLSKREVQADLARGLIALANHGGGWILFGFTEGASDWRWTEPCPYAPELYGPDAINNISKRYADPAFHCQVRRLRSSAGNEHVVIEIPGGHRVPIRSKRGGPDGSKLKQNVYYIRRPRPESAPIEEAHEWDALLKRCISNQRDDLLSSFRAIVGAIGTDAVTPLLHQDAPLVRWRNEAHERFVAAASGAGQSELYARGTFSSAYRLLDIPLLPTLTELVEALRGSEGRETGWPAWLVHTPRPVDDGVEYLEMDPSDGAHADFWRVTRDGKAFLVRAYQEDFWGRNVEPGTALSLTIPTWRTGECLLHASRLASRLGATRIEFSMEWTGLRGRALRALEGSRYIGRQLLSHQDVVSTSIEADVADVSDALPELVRPLLDPLYEVFDFFQVPPNFYAEELAKMRSRR
jgi:hypothetical protein